MARHQRKCREAIKKVMTFMALVSAKRRRVRASRREAIWLIIKYLIRASQKEDNVCAMRAAAFLHCRHVIDGMEAAWARL